MKIAYALFWLDGPESGVIKKILLQTTRWHELGHEFHIFIFTKISSRLYKEKGKLYAMFNNNCTVLAYKTTIDWQLKSWKLFIYIKNIEPDLIYIRYFKYSIGLSKLLRTYRTVMEINSDDLSESKWFSPGNLYNRIFRNFLLKDVAAFVSVTNELMLNQHFAKFNKKYKVIANGADLTKCEKLPEKTHSVTFDFLFIGTDGQNWHGIDEIISLSKIKPNWQFHFVGTFGTEYRESIGENVFFYGTLDFNQFFNIAKECDVGIGTMALYRKNMKEACPLKVREYLCLGLPVIIGYDDVDFPGHHDFICKLPNKPNNLVDNALIIEQFVSKWKGKRVSLSDIVHLDVRKKEEERLSFFKYILSEKI